MAGSTTAEKKEIIQGVKVADGVVINDLTPKTERFRNSMIAYNLESNPWFQRRLKMYENIGTGIMLEKMDPALRFSMTKTNDVEIINPLSKYPFIVVCECGARNEIDGPGDYACGKCERQLGVWDDAVHID